MTAKQSTTALSNYSSPPLEKSLVSDRKPQNTETLRKNRIICGDVLEVLRKTKKNEQFDVVIVDPPYNIGNNKDTRKMTEYVQWSEEWLNECLRLAKSQAQIFVYGFPEILAHIAVRYPISNQRWLVWHYTNKAVPSSKFWQRSYESILCLWKGDRPKINVDAVRVPYSENYMKCAGKVRKETKSRYGSKNKKTIYNAHINGALPRDVIKVPALAGGAGYTERWFYCQNCKEIYEPRHLREHGDHNVIKHPTQKPTRLTEQLILSVAIEKNKKLLVPFAGSGSECIVAHSLGIAFYGIEINPDYIKLAEGWLSKLNK